MSRSISSLSKVADDKGSEECALRVNPPIGAHIIISSEALMQGIGTERLTLGRLMDN